MRTTINAQTTAPEAFMHVMDPMIVPKSPTHFLKTIIKNLMLHLGVSYHGWRSVHTLVGKDNYSRLPDHRMEELKKYSWESVSGHKARMPTMSDEELKSTCEYVPMNIVKDIINRDAKFNRIVNVGSSFPFFECKFIAARYPGVHWDMLDFAENLETEAQTIKTDNVEFFSCYPLDWLRSNDTRRYDIAYFNRVLVLLTNSELRSYLSIIKTIARYIVFCEPACINKFTLPVCLDKIPSHQSIPTYGLIPHFPSIVDIQCGEKAILL